MIRYVIHVIVPESLERYPRIGIIRSGAVGWVTTFDGKGNSRHPGVLASMEADPINRMNTGARRG